ncbi:MAG TPA: CPBP family intramembrane glutamic endopeptidase [Acidobacteriaceae bacterium]|nr:CPBP family intramembrane glutamic endopeptidase [Acidobacteriaceae bacterium]
MSYPLREPPPEESATTPASVFANDAGLRPWWRLLLYLAIVLTPWLLMKLAEHMAVATAQPQVIQQLSPVVEGIEEWMQFGYIFFATWIMSRIEDRDVFDYGLQPARGSVRRGLLGAVWGLLCMSLLILMLWSTHHLVFTGILQHGAGAALKGAAWAFTFIGVGLFEEFFFRGYLLYIVTLCFVDLLRRRFTRASSADTAAFWCAAVFISFAFGFVHSANPGESPIGLVCAGLAGLVFAFTLWRTGSLWWAIGFHAAWDWAQSFLFGVADSGGVSAGRLLSSRPQGSALMSGGSTGPEGSLFVLAIMLLITLIVVTTLRRSGTPVSGTSVLPWPHMEKDLAPEVH